MAEKDDRGKVLVFPEAEPHSVVAPVTAGLMTTDVMSQAVDGLVLSVRGEVSANQGCDNEEDGDVVIQVNFDRKER